MPKSKHYMPLSTEDSFTNGTVTEPENSQGTPFPSLVSPKVNKVHPKRSEHHTDDSPGEEHTAGVAAGRLPEEVYANTLPGWRAELRRKCVAMVEWESKVIAEWQVRPSTPFRLLKGKSSSSSSSIVLRRHVSGRLG